MKNDKDLRLGEAKGEVKTLPKFEDIQKTEKILESVIDSPEEFRTAIGRCQMDRVDHIEVTERMFEYLVKGHATPYLCYGNPGIKVYRVGTKPENDRLERMSAEDYSRYLATRRNALV